MKKNQNNQCIQEKQLSLNFSGQQTKVSKKEIKIVSFNDYKSYSEMNILRDIVENTRSY